MSKPNIGTVKRFITKKFASGDLYLKVKSKFYGMTDGVEYVKDRGYELAQADTSFHECTLGIQGIWIVSGSGCNLIKEVTEGDLVGYEVYNCCGSFIVLADSLK